MSIVTVDGGLTALGYGLSILAAALFFFIAGMISRNQKTKISARQLVFCGTAMALAYIASYIRLIPKMPYGGSVTLFSMLFICLIGYWYGVRAGIMTGLAYGILQFIQEPYVLSLFQVCCDYVLAFAGLGLPDCSPNQKTVWSKAISWEFWFAACFTSLAAISTGWTICRRISPSSWLCFTRLSITIPIFWQKAS